MLSDVLLEVVKIEHAERIRAAQRDYVAAMVSRTARRTRKRPSALKTLLLALGRS